MKKLLTYACVFSMILTLAAGCSKKETSKKESTKSTGSANSGLDYSVSDYVTLGDYTGLKGYKVSCEVSDSEVQEEIQSQLSDAATYSDIKDRGAKKGDIITIDYSAKVDGKEVKDCKETDYEITLGNNEFNKTLEKKLLGAKVKDEIQTDLKIPKDLSSTNAGDKATFTMTVKKLQKEKIPKYNLDYVKKNTEYTSLKDYEASVKEELLSTKEDDYYSETVGKLLQEAVKNSKFKKDYPKSLYKECEEEFYEGIDYYAQMFGMERDAYLKSFAGMDDKAVKEAIIETLHEKLVVYAIAEKEKKFLSDKEYKEYVASIAEQYGYQSAEDLEKDYSEDTIRYAAVYDNVSEVLYNNAKLEKIKEEDYQKLSAQEEKETTEAASEETTEVTTETEK